MGEFDATSVIEAAIADHPEREAPSEESAQPVEQPAAEEKAEDTDEQELASLEKDLVTKDERLSRGSIATARHQAVLTRERNRAAAERKALEEAHAKALEKYKPYEGPDFENQLKAIQLAESNPAAFLAMLREYPQYADLLGAKKDDVKEERFTPAPDTYDAQGKPIYAAETVEKLVAQAIADVRKELQPVLQDREQNQKFRQMADKARAEVEAAMAWDGFADNRDAIMKYHAENKKASLFDAYRAVVIPKFKTDREAMEKEIREKITKEQNSRVGGPPRRLAPNDAAETKGAEKPRDSEDLIREAIRKHTAA